MMINASMSTTRDTSTDSKRSLLFDTVKVIDSFSTRTSESDEKDEDKIIMKLGHLCLKLKPYAKVFKSNLTDEQIDVVASINEILLTHYSDDELYEKLYKSVVKHFSEFQDALPGTLAKYMMGCEGKNRFHGEPSCSADCAGSIPPPKKYLKNFCNTHVGLFREGNFEHAYRPPTKTDTILIHNLDDECTLSRKDIEFLKDKGINYAIISNIRDGKYVSKSKKLDLELLPRKNTTKSSTSTKSEKSTNSEKSATNKQSKNLFSDSTSKTSKSSSKKKDKCPDSDSDSESSSWIAWLIIFVIVILLVVFVIFWILPNRDYSPVKYESYSNKHSSSIRL